MKRALLAVSLMAVALSSHAFAIIRDQDKPVKGVEETLFVIHVKSDKDSDYRLKVNGRDTGVTQFIFANEVADFPIYVANSVLVDDSATICVLEDDLDAMKKEICVIEKAQ